MKKLIKEKKLLEEQRKKLIREVFGLVMRQEQIRDDLIRKITKN